MYRQFAKPPGQTPGEYSRDYPRTTTVDGDDQRYGKLKAPIGDGLFAAYDPLEMKAAKYLIVASSDYLYTPRSLFWPDVIFFTAPKLDWGQAIGMMISVRRVVSMEPQVIVVAGSNDHLQSRGLLSRLTDGSIPSNEVIGEAIMTLLSAMAEVEAAAKQRFTHNVVKVVFVLSPGYAALPEPLQSVYTMVTTIAEGRFNVIIPAPNRVLDPDNYYPFRSELPAVWADISNAIQGLRDCSTTRLVLDEVLGLELSNFARLLKLRPGVDDDHLLVQQVADDLWFRQMDHAENEQGRIVRKNMTSAEEDLMAMALRTKPHNNVWLYLSPRLCTLGEDAFEHAPAVIKEIHVYLKNLFDARELAGGMMLKLMQDVNTMSLDKFQADVLATRAQYERSDAILGGMGVGWTPSFLSTCYPRASRNLIASFVRDIRKLSIGLVLALYVTFGHENFVKGPANLFTQAMADLRLDGLLTLIAMTYGRLGDLLVLLRYPEQLQGPSREFNAQLETASLKKMKDWRTLLLQYLLQQNRSVTGKPGETDLGALERDLLEYGFSEDDDGEVDGSLLLMTPSSFMSPTKEASADLSPIDPISQARECRSRDPQKLLHESPRRRKIEESMRVSFLSTLPEEEWERYQSELEGKTGTTWSRVNFMERSWDVIRRYGTQSIMKVGLNQPIMREVLEKIVNSMESDVLTESVTEDSADDQQVAKKLPVRRTRKGLKRLKGKTGSRAMNPRVVKSRASAVVTSLTSAGRSGESRQGDSATLTGGEKENLIPPMLLAGLTTTAVRSKKTARTLADTKLEMEIISQCGSGGLEDYRPSRTNIAKLKLEGQLDVVEYSRVTVPESVHMGDPAGGYVEMLKARNSARGHLMAWSEKRAMQEYLKELTENSNLNRQEYGTVMSSEANEIGLERLLEISWRAALQRYFDESMHAPATVAAYLAHPCMRTDLQVRLAWCLMGIKKAEYEASNDSKSREQELELMEALRALISKDDSAIAWAKRKNALCFVRFVVDRIPTPVLGECIKIIRQKGVDCERNFFRALLELYQDMPLTVPNKESNDMESYCKLEEVRRYSNKELKVSRELIEAVKGQKEFATLGKLKSFQYVSGIPGMAYNPFVNEEAREAYFDYEQVIVLNFWVERIKETGMLMVEQPKLGIILEERVVEPSVPELKGQVSFDCGSWDGPLKTSLVTMWELMKPSWCPHPNAGLIWDMTADITLDLDDDASLHDLAMIHHLLAMRLTKRKSNPSTEQSEEGPSSNWLKQGTCLA